MKYIYPEGDFISGFGGGYEEACQKMVIAGMEWLEKNPTADPRWKEIENVYGITTDENEDAKKLMEFMVDAVDRDATGAMVQATLGHVRYAHQKGWEEYIKKITEK